MHFRNVVTIFKSIIVVLLFIVYYIFFFKGVMENYKAGLTNIAAMAIDFDEQEIGMKAPTFVICMEPAWKKEILDYYNITSQSFTLQSGNFDHLKGNLSMKEIISEASFILNEDFDIAITTYQKPFEGSTYLNIGTNTFVSKGNGFSINVTEMFSFNRGLCYSIKSNLYLSTKYSYLLSVILRSNGITQKPNQLRLTVASDDDTTGIVSGFWGNAEPMILANIQFNNETTMLDLKETINKRILNCNKNELFQECLATGLANMLKVSDCPGKCKPMVIKAYYDKFIGTGETPPDCINIEDENCLIQYVEKISEPVISQCKSQCIVQDYSARSVNIREIPLSLKDGERADLCLTSSTRSRILVQEYEVYDTAGMIGTVGGSLGLFLGFSFYGVFSDGMDILVKKIIKQS